MDQWGQLSVDLQADILSRIPAKSLARFRSISKAWNALLKSGRIGRAPSEESLIIMLKDLRVYWVRISLHSMAASEFYLKDPLSDSSQVDIRSVFHCDGLFLCATKDERLVVWNPCSGETMWIRPRTSYKKSDYYALGYDNNKQYKILRVDRQDDVVANLKDGPSRIKNEYEVYDLSSSSWRVVGMATDWFLPSYSRGFSVKGHTYWVATPARKSSPTFLLCFDFLTESFQSLSLPHPFPYRTVVLSVVREEKLCLLGIDRDWWGECADAYPSDLQTWVTTSSGSAMSWSKSLALRRSILKFSRGISFLADEPGKVVVCLNRDKDLHILGKNKHILKDLGGDSTWMSSSTVLLNYVPSLALIQQGAPFGGRKRKAPSK